VLLEEHNTTSNKMCVPESDVVLLLRSKALRVLLYLRRSASCMESW